MLVRVPGERRDAARTRGGLVAVSNGFRKRSKSMRRIEWAGGGIGSNGSTLSRDGAMGTGGVDADTCVMSGGTLGSGDGRGGDGAMGVFFLLA